MKKINFKGDFIPYNGSFILYRYEYLKGIIIVLLSLQ